MLNIHDAEIIRKLFHDSTPMGHTSNLSYLRGEISPCDNRVFQAWDVMVAYIRDAEAEHENRD